MAVPPAKARVTVAAYLDRVRAELIPVNPQFSYFAGGTSFNDEDVREYITEPIAALPPSVATLLPKVTLLLVPFLERVNGDRANGTSEKAEKAEKAEKDAPRPNGRQQEVQIALEQPTDGRWVPYVSLRVGGEVVIALSVENQETADYHYHLYHELAHLAAEKLPVERVGEYAALVSEELRAGAHGEVDDESWTMKQAVRRHHGPAGKSSSRKASAAKPSKALASYARASFIDTLTLYLHGICCDIDVEPGPRQLPSRHLRRRLKLLQTMLPAPKGYAVFPEELDGAGARDARDAHE